MIKVENIPSGVLKDYLILYFESPKHGGGQVSSIQMSPEENSAIVTFCDHQGSVFYFCRWLKKTKQKFASGIAQKQELF